MSFINNLPTTYSSKSIKMNKTLYKKNMFYIYETKINKERHLVQSKIVDTLENAQRLRENLQKISKLPIVYTMSIKDIYITSYNLSNEKRFVVNVITDAFDQKFHEQRIERLIRNIRFSELEVLSFLSICLNFLLSVDVLFKANIELDIIGISKLRFDEYVYLDKGFDMKINLVEWYCDVFNLILKNEAYNKRTQIMNVMPKVDTEYNDSNNDIKPDEKEGNDQMKEKPKVIEENFDNEKKLNNDNSQSNDKANAYTTTKDEVIKMKNEIIIEKDNNFKPNIDDKDLKLNDKNNNSSITKNIPSENNGINNEILSDNHILSGNNTVSNNTTVSNTKENEIIQETNYLLEKLRYMQSEIEYIKYFRPSMISTLLLMMNGTKSWDTEQLTSQSLLTGIIENYPGFNLEIKKFIANFWDNLIYSKVDLLLPSIAISNHLISMINTEIAEQQLSILKNLPPIKNEEAPDKIIKIRSEADLINLAKSLGLIDLLKGYYQIKDNLQPYEEIDLNKIENLDFELVDVNMLFMGDLMKITFPCLKSLALRACNLVPSAIKFFINSNLLSKLETLDFSGDATNHNIVNDEGIQNICNSYQLSNLKTLKLSACQVSDKGLEMICKCMNFINLEKLVLNDNQNITKEGLRSINQSFVLKNLNHLSLVSVYLADEGINLLLDDQIETNLLKNYKYLNLADCHITNNGILKVLTSRQCQTLESLHLDANYVSVFDISLNQRYLPQLRTLSIMNCKLTDLILTSLMSYLYYETIYSLDVSFNPFLTFISVPFLMIQNIREIYFASTGINDWMIQDIAIQEKKLMVEKLTIRKGEQLTEKAFNFMSNYKMMPNLRHLEMLAVQTGCFFFDQYPLTSGSNTLQAFVGLQINLRYAYTSHIFKNTLYMINLKELDLSGNLIGDASFRVLCSTNKLDNLEKFGIVLGLITDVSLITLTRSKYLQKLSFLNLEYNFLSKRAIVKFLKNIKYNYRNYSKLNFKNQTSSDKFTNMDNMNKLCSSRKIQILIL